MTSVERENGFHKISVGNRLHEMSSIRSEGGENGLHEINGGEISGDDSITCQRTDAPR